MLTPMVGASECIQQRFTQALVNAGGFCAVDNPLCRGETIILMLLSQNLFDFLRFGNSLSCRGKLRIDHQIHFDYQRCHSHNQHATGQYQWFWRIELPSFRPSSPVNE